VQRLVGFAETAALAVQINVIVSNGTAVAHLTGALGLPLHLMLPPNLDSRRIPDRRDSPWHPTARLFRQPRRSAWNDVVLAVIAEPNAA
jgi:hypothetical protein